MVAVVDGEGRFCWPWLRDSLVEAQAQVRGHALLVHGAPGDGAWEFGLALGMAQLCESKGARRPCGHCGACNLVNGWSHPDFHWLMPQDTALQRGVPVQVDERRKPSKQIRIDEVRAAIDACTSTTGRGQGRALVIFPGEAMNAIAASALLKTLEEPPAGTRIVICAAEPARLLPTIRSRCQRWTLPRVAPAVARAWLGEQGIPGPDVLLAACNGHPLQALAMHEAGMTAERWTALPERVAQGDAAALAGAATPALLEAMAKLCHDAMAAAVGGQPRFFPGSKWTAGLSLRRLSDWHRQLQKLQRHADHPWNEALLVDAVVAEARSALQPATSGRRTDNGALATLDP